MDAPRGLRRCGIRPVRTNGGAPGAPIRRAPTFEWGPVPARLCQKHFRLCILLSVCSGVHITAAGYGLSVLQGYQVKGRSPYTCASATYHSKQQRVSNTASFGMHRACGTAWYYISLASYTLQTQQVAMACTRCPAH